MGNTKREPELRFRDGDGKAFPEWEYVTLKEAVQHGDVRLGRGKVISAKDMEKSEKGLYPVYSSSSRNNGLMGYIDDFMFDEELISWSIDGGGHLFYRPKHKFSITNVSGFMKVDTTKIIYSFVIHQLEKQRIRFDFDYQNKAHPSVILDLYRLYLPCIDEQKKLAAFFTALDRRITLQQERVELLEKRKKGMMQRVFKQEIRFRDEDGEAFPEWKTKSLGNFVTFFKGKGLKKDDISPLGGHKCLHYGELFSSEIVIKEAINRTNICEGIYSESGDILIPDSDVTPTGLGRASVLMESGVLIGGGCHILRSTEVDPVFLAFLLNSQKEKIISKVTGSTVKHIYAADLKSLIYKVSIDFNEQKKIAAFLSTLDREIASEQKKLEQLREQKKGFMQKMFI